MSPMAMSTFQRLIFPASRQTSVNLARWKFPMGFPRVGWYLEGIPYLHGYFNPFSLLVLMGIYLPSPAKKLFFWRVSKIGNEKTKMINRCICICVISPLGPGTMFSGAFTEAPSKSGQALWKLRLADQCRTFGIIWFSLLPNMFII